MIFGAAGRPNTNKYPRGQIWQNYPKLPRFIINYGTFPSLFYVPKFYVGVPKTVLLVNRAFVPPEKKGVFDENGENDESAF